MRLSERCVIDPVYAGAFFLSLRFRTYPSSPCPAAPHPPRALSLHSSAARLAVWAYGIVVFEIFSHADLPYKGWTNSVVEDNVRHGHQLNRAPDCPLELYDGVVRPCLQKDAEDRPTFDHIVAKFAVAAFCPVPPLGRVALETEVDASGPAADPAGNADVNAYRVVAALPSLIGHGQIQVQEPYVGPGHADVVPYRIVSAMPAAANIYVEVVHPHTAGPAADS